MKRKAFKLTLMAAAVGLAAGSVQAADIRIDGFASIVYGQLLDKDEGPTFGTNYDSRGTFEEDSIYGIQFRSDLGEGLSATAQFTGKGAESYDAKVNWAYITYEISDTLTLKGGRQRMPWFTYSDFLDVGYAYHWIAPPNEIYYLGLDTIDGLNLEHYTDIGDWTSRFNLVYGGIRFDDPEQGVVESENSWLVSWTLNYDWLTLRAIYNEAQTTAEGLAGLADGINELIPLAGASLTKDQVDLLSIERDKGSFAGIGVTADWGDFFIVSEYTVIKVEDAPTSEERKGGYVSFGTRLDKFTLSLTYTTYENPNTQEVLDLLDTVIDPSLAAIASGALNGFFPAQVPADAVQAGAGQLLAAIPAAYRNGVEIDSYNFTVRYDFHPSAAFKADITQESAEYDQGYGTITELEPILFRMGVDLVF